VSTASSILDILEIFVGSLELGVEPEHQVRDLRLSAAADHLLFIIKGLTSANTID
jgi:hypothetical protein